MRTDRPVRGGSFRGSLHCTLAVRGRGPIMDLPDFKILSSGRSEVSVGVQRGARIVGLIPGRSFEASQAPSPSEVIKNTCDHPDALVLRFRSLSIISHQSQFRPFSLFFLYYFTAKAPCSGNGIRKCKFRLAYAQLCNVCGNFHFLGVVQYGLRVLR